MSYGSWGWHSMIRLMTTFNNRPAPGGLLDLQTGIYYKSCRSLNGGQHPHRYDLGGIDAPIVERLKSLRCKKIVLEIPGATYEILFERFLACGYPQKWNDTRFPYPRWYAPASVWNIESPTGYKTQEAREKQPTERQTSLFGTQELQDIAVSGRLAR